MKTECSAVFPVYLFFKDEIERFVLKKVKSKAIAEDITAQLSLKMYHHCEKLAEVENVKAWLYRVASNVVNDYFRQEKKKQEQSINELHEDLTEQELHLQGIVEECLVELLHRLPAKYQEAVRLADLEGISQKDIAIKLNISYSAAKMRVQRGRGQLKSMFYECCSHIN